MKISLLLATGLMALTISGCATLFGEKNRTVLVTSQPTGANVYYQGAFVGQTPTVIQISNPLEGATVEVKKEGYFANVASVKTSIQFSTFLNIFFWPGFIVDVLTGDIKRVDPHLSVPLNANTALTEATSKATQ